jgi:hypothetical protein
MPEPTFKLIKLKQAPGGSARTFPSEISTPQAAIAFVNSLNPETRAKLHWRVAAAARNCRRLSAQRCGREGGARVGRRTTD